MTKHEEQEKLLNDFVLPKSAESENTGTPGRKASLNFQGANNVSRVSSYEERNKSSRKSARVSFKRYLSFIYFLYMLSIIQFLFAQCFTDC